MFMERFRLDGRRAVVTGAGRGIGAIIARALAEAGAEIVIVDVEAYSAVETAGKLTAKGHKVHPRQADVIKPEVVDALRADIESTVGPVDILVNNAGIGIVKSPLETEVDLWLRTMDVNVNAMFYCSKAFGAGMVARGAGAIVNLGSICGFVATVPQNSPSYITSKGAVHLMTKSLACAWAKYNVRVNAVAPGYILSEMTRPLREEFPHWHDRWIDMTPMERLGKPDEIASAVLFLASDAASYCTGTILSVDGGYTSL
jgi:galactitol 2-dehydrogenase (L-tagatose-forming)